MRTHKRKMVALLVALMMLMGLVPAFAEAPAQENPIAALLKSGNNLKTEFTIQLNPQLGAMIAGFTGGEPDEATMNTFNTVISAINKLKGSFVLSATGVSGFLGTETGSLMDMRASYKEDGSELKMTSSLLPGLFLSIDPAMMAKFASQMQVQSFDHAKALELAQPYLNVLNEEIGKVQQAAGSEEGSYETGYGTFTKRTVVPVTNHMLAGLVVKLGEVYEKDAALQETVKQMTEANKELNESIQPAAEGETPAPAQPEDPIKDLVESAKEQLTKEDRQLFDLTVYENDTNYYFDLVSPLGSEQQTNVQVLAPKAVGKDSPNKLVEVKIILAGATYPTPGEEPVKTDWAVLEQAILSNQDYSSTLITLKVTAVNETESKVNSEMNLSLLTSGISAGIAVNTNADLSTLVSTTEVALSAMMPDPLLKVIVNSAPTKDQPEAPVTEGAKEVVLKEEMSKEDEALIQQSMGSVGQDILSRLMTALPEEAPAIIKLIQDSQSGQESEVVPEPQPEVIEEGETETAPGN